MASNLSKGDAITPIITFISMVVIGIIISEFIITNESLQLPIILFSFVAGILLAALELRSMISRRKIERANMKPKPKPEGAKKRLAKYVAELFEEDIPFDELEQEEKKKLERLEQFSAQKYQERLDQKENDEKNNG